MRGTVRVSKRPAKMRARLSVSGLASDATADVTDLMLQGGGTETGWVPHLHEMMTATGGDVSPELEARVGDPESGQSVLTDRVSSVEDEASSAQSTAESALSMADTLNTELNTTTGVIDIADRGTRLDTSAGGAGMYIERRGRVVQLTLAAVRLNTSSYITETNLIPPGFRHSSYVYAVVSMANGHDQVRTIDVRSSGSVRFRAVASDELMRGTFMWFTDEDWPSEYPPIGN